MKQLAIHRSFGLSELRRNITTGAICGMQNVTEGDDTVLQNGRQKMR